MILLFISFAIIVLVWLEHYTWVWRCSPELFIWYMKELEIEDPHSLLETMTDDDIVRANDRLSKCVKFTH